MNVEQSENHETEFQLTNITEEEYQLMFLEGLKEVVHEVREGKTEYVVLPYNAQTANLMESSKPSTVELADEDVDALVQVGAVAMIKRGIESAKEPDLWDNLEQATQEAGDAWDEQRMDVIGQNGNDGLHYIDYGAGKRPVQHKMKTGEFGELRDGFLEP